MEKSLDNSTEKKHTNQDIIDTINNAKTDYSKAVNQVNMSDSKVHMYSPLSLAYIGDAVMDLLVKTYFVTHINKQTYKYHNQVCGIVNAISQSAYIDEIFDSLSDEEKEIFKRGRNANPHSKAKSATASQYHKATGLEALCGYLYLKGDMNRLNEIVDNLIQRHI